MKQQTAVEWLVSILNKEGFAPVLTDKEIQQAKEMDKKSHEETWDAAHQTGRFEGKGIAEENYYTFEQYYNETYGGDK